MPAWRLSFCGQKLLLQPREHIRRYLEQLELERMGGVFARGVVCAEEDETWAGLEREGWLERCAPERDLGAIALRLRRNPLEHVTRLTLEYTQACGQGCRHCRSGFFPPQTERDPEALARAGEKLAALNFSRLEFVGGEVIRHGAGWLRVARRLRAAGSWRIGVMSSGWWLGIGPFRTADRGYGSEGELLAEIKENGVDYVTLSVDGDEARHDANRAAPGLFRRLRAGIASIRSAGLDVRFALLLSAGAPDPAYLSALADLARRAVDLPPGAADDEALRWLFKEEENGASHLVDIGRAPGGGNPVSGLGVREAYCRAFFRPAPAVRIQPDGGISTCPLLPPGEGFGDIHRDDARNLLNRLEEWPAYGLHAGRRAGEYLALADTRLFGDSFLHPCRWRVILTMMARRIGPLPSRLPAGELARINREVASLLIPETTG